MEDYSILFDRHEMVYYDYLLYVQYNYIPLMLANTEPNDARYLT